MLDYAAANGLMEDDITHRDLFDTKIMGCLTPLPSMINNKFLEKSNNDEYFINISIKGYRIFELIN